MESVKPTKPSCSSMFAGPDEILYIGLTLSIPENSTAASLEGDPYIDIDNTSSNFIHYTGTEDYFDGGFYFGFQLFSFPFTGHLKLFQKFIGFIISMLFDFKKSIKKIFLFQHGGIMMFMKIIAPARIITSFGFLFGRHGILFGQEKIGISAEQDIIPMVLSLQTWME